MQTFEILIETIIPSLFLVVLPVLKVFLKIILNQIDNFIQTIVPIRNNKRPTDHSVCFIYIQNITHLVLNIIYIDFNLNSINIIENNVNIM